MKEIYIQNQASEDTKILQVENNLQNNNNSLEGSQVYLQPEVIDETINKTILVVEELEHIREYIYQILKRSYNVVKCTNGQDAISLMGEINIDMLISGVMMTKMDGYLLCTKFKTSKYTSHIPVILLNSHNSAESHIAALKTGADAMLVKPFKNELLLSQIKNLLLQRQQLKESYQKINVSDKFLYSDYFDSCFISKVDYYIEKNMDNVELGADFLSRSVGLCRSQVYRKLKYLTGHSVTDYIRISRVKKAVEFLKQHNYSIFEIAVLTGFNSPSYFSRSFKKVFNIPPKEYRQKFCMD